MKNEKGKYKPTYVNRLNVYKQSNIPQTNYNTKTMMIGWNCKSLNRNKILCVNYMIKIYNPEFLIIYEAWLDH